MEAPRAEEGSLNPPATPLADALRRVTAALIPASRMVPRMMAASTDAGYFRWKGVAAYGFALRSMRIPRAGQALTSIQVLRDVLARKPKCIEVKA